MIFAVVFLGGDLHFLGSFHFFGLLLWWGYSDNEGSKYRFSVSIKEEDKLVGFASYENTVFINWSSSKKNNNNIF